MYDEILDKKDFVEFLTKAGVEQKNLENEYSKLVNIFNKALVAVAITKLPENAIDAALEQFDFSNKQDVRIFLNELLKFLSEKKISLPPIVIEAKKITLNTYASEMVRTIS